MPLNFNDSLVQVLLCFSFFLKKKKKKRLAPEKNQSVFYLETRKWIIYKKSKKRLQLLFLLDLLCYPRRVPLHYVFL